MTATHLSIDEITDSMIALMPAIMRGLRPGTHASHGCPGGSLGPSDLRIVLHLALHGPDGVSAIAHAVGLSRPAVTEALERLRSRALIERTPGTDDRRRVVISLQPEARAFATGVIANWRQRFQASLAQLSPEEQSGFLKGMQALANVPLIESG